MSFVGIDVGKRRLTVCDRTRGRTWEVAQTATDRAALVKTLVAAKVTRIALEATADYDRPVADALTAAGLYVMRLNPRQARDLARGFRVLAKTDRVDAQVLALIAEKLEHPAWVIPPPEQQALQALVGRRVDLVQMRTQESNRLEQAVPTAVRRSIQRQLRQLNQEIERIETAIEQAIAQDPTLAAEVHVLDAEPGVGRITAITLRVLVPELGRISRTQISALVGVAPFANDSEQRRGIRSIRGGRAAPRSALYMAALSGLSHNPPIRAMYHRLKAAGKPSKVAITACMRKLLVRLNAQLRDARADAKIAGRQTLASA